jgi:hypothetical protein
MAFVAVAGAAIAAERSDESPAFARLREAVGSVRVERGDHGTGGAAEINQPLQTGDRVRTGDGRAELELADATVVWIDRDSLVELRALSDPIDRVDPGDVIGLLQGSVQIEASEPAGSEVIARVDSAAASVYLLSAGLFRVEALRGLTTLVSFGGLAEFSGEEGSVLVRSAQRSVAPEGSAPTEPRRQTSDRRDPFDSWVADRIALFAPSSGGGEVSRAEIPAAIEPYVGELARFGAWQKLPPIGTVWRPHQTVSWAPFQRGRWLASAAGWFWVSGEPWGWAPYRFGRWEQRMGLGWVWIPGSIWGAAWAGFAVGPTQIGWCPLNFWNQPVLAGASGATLPSAGAARLDPHAWMFVPIDRFARPVSAQAAIRTDKQPRPSDLVLTRRLPEFDPLRLGESVDGLTRLLDQVRRSGSVFASRGGDAKPISFLSDEQAARASSGSPAGARRRGAIAVTRAATAPPPAHPPRTAAALPDAERQGHAVQRLVEGTHPDPPVRRTPRPAASPPASPQPHTGPRGGSQGGRSPGTPATLPPLPPPGDEPSEDSPH